MHVSYVSISNARCEELSNQIFLILKMAIFFEIFIKLKRGQRLASEAGFSLFLLSPKFLNLFNFFIGLTNAVKNRNVFEKKNIYFYLRRQKQNCMFQFCSLYTLNFKVNCVYMLGCWVFFSLHFLEGKSLLSIYYKKYKMVTKMISLRSTISLHLIFLYVQIKEK